MVSLRKKYKQKLFKTARAKKRQQQFERVNTFKMPSYINPALTNEEQLDIMERLDNIYNNLLEKENSEIILNGK